MILGLRILEESFQKKLLVIGNGKIGKIVARLMKNFMIVKSYDVLTNSEKELKHSISESDCITIHIPKTKKTFLFLIRKNYHG